MTDSHRMHQTPDMKKKMVSILYNMTRYDVKLSDNHTLQQ